MTIDREAVPNGTVQPLHERYPEAYKLMLGFYTNPAFYNSSPDCRPADNVLMAIEYARQKSL